MLTFFGRGNAFSEYNNSAFFIHRNELVLIDFPMSSFYKLKVMQREDGIPAEKCTVLVTHTHGDHIGGIATLIQYSHYILQRHIDVIAPSDKVAENLRFLIKSIEGCDDDAYTVTTAGKTKRDWLCEVIPTKHVPELDGQCFGYLLDIDGRRTVYTGDTAVIEPFLPYLTDGTVLYSDVSFRKNPVHLHLDDLLDSVSGKNIELYLMHLDDEDAITSAIKGTDVKLAPLYIRNEPEPYYENVSLTVSG